MARNFRTISRPVDSDFGRPVVHSKMTKLPNGQYKMSTVINGVTVEAVGNSEGMAAELLGQRVDEMTVSGELSGLIN